MGFLISWQIEGEQQLLRKLQIAQDKVKDWKPAFRQVASVLKKTFSNNVYDTRGRAVDENWPKLSPQYLAQKRKDGYPSQPLVRTGKMKKSFKTLFKSDLAAVWNTAAYFKYHQSNKSRRKIPRRVMMKLANQQRETIQKIFQKHYLKEFK